VTDEQLAERRVSVPMSSAAVLGTALALVRPAVAVADSSVEYSAIQKAQDALLAATPPGKTAGSTARTAQAETPATIQYVYPVVPVLWAGLFVLLMAVVGVVLLARVRRTTTTPDTHVDHVDPS
jgi:hypothetical protein